MYTAPQRSCGAEYTTCGPQRSCGPQAASQDEVLRCSKVWNPQLRCGFHTNAPQLRCGALFDFQPKLRFGVKIKSFHCEFTVRCKHLTLWDLQLKAADLTPMQLSAALEFAMECCIGYANAAIVQQVYHLLDSTICSRCATCCIVAYFFVDRNLGL